MLVAIDLSASRGINCLSLSILSSFVIIRPCCAAGSQGHSSRRAQGHRHKRCHFSAAQRLSAKEAAPAVTLKRTRHDGGNLFDHSRTVTPVFSASQPSVYFQPSFTTLTQALGNHPRRMGMAVLHVPAEPSDT
eukprot:TRINITY_DN5696_c0_g1_i2.p3 TRINITY_DN5696_c0_g1~~TRINITY_DN5696_c0_g1_i2.p3  ORF type:complete len:133 (+),score=13.58 TRINITY_DN5696_c0_g1_i2:816-1214(+)